MRDYGSDTLERGFDMLKFSKHLFSAESRQVRSNGGRHQLSEYVAIVAISGVIKRGGTNVLITREAIESIPEQFTGDRAMPIIPDHNPYCLPIGKTKEAWIQPHGDKYAAKMRIHFEDTYSIGTHRGSGLELVRLDFDDCPRPFVKRAYGEIEQPQDKLSVDLANFDDMKDYTEFKNEVGLIDDAVACDNGIGRHSLVPEPFIQFVLSDPEISAALAIGAWGLGRVEKFVRYTVDEMLRKVADDISDVLSTRIKKLLRAYMRRCSVDKRPVTTQLVIPGNMELVLLVKTEHGDEFPNLDLRKLTAEMERYGDLLQGADSATFACVGGNEWEFQYLTTQSGKVIGSLKCYERTMNLMKCIRQACSSRGEESDMGASIQGTDDSMEDQT